VEVEGRLGGAWWVFKDQTVAVARHHRVGQWVGQAGTHAAFVIPARRHGFQ